MPLTKGMEDRAMSGSAFGSGSERPSKAFKANRLCAEDGCQTKLSIYNSGKFCYQHEPMVVPRTRGKKIA